MPTRFGAASGRRPLLLRRVDGLAGPVLVLSALITTAYVLEAVTSFGASRSGSASAGGLGHGVIEQLTFLLLVTQLGVTGTWLIRVQRNAKELWPQGVDHAAAWAYAGWLVPILSLFMPKLIVDQSWRVTADAIDDESSAGSTSWWWAGWLVFSFLGGLDSRMGSIHPRLEVVVAVVSSAALLAWTRVVRAVTATQDRLVTALAGS
jgi:hypothetical protein